MGCIFSNLTLMKDIFDRMDVFWFMRSTDWYLLLFLAEDCRWLFIMQTLDNVSGEIYLQMCVYFADK